MDDQNFWLHRDSVEIPKPFQLMNKKSRIFFVKWIEINKPTN